MCEIKNTLHRINSRLYTAENKTSELENIIEAIQNEIQRSKTFREAQEHVGLLGRAEYPCN